MNEEKRVILVNFITRDGTLSKSYAYYTNIPDLVVDDWAVVIVRSIPTCVKVVRTKNIPQRKIDLATKWIIQKVDMSNLEEPTR